MLWHATGSVNPNQVLCSSISLTTCPSQLIFNGKLNLLWSTVLVYLQSFRRAVIMGENRGIPTPYHGEDRGVPTLYPWGSTPLPRPFFFIPIPTPFFPYFFSCTPPKFPHFAPPPISPPPIFMPIAPLPPPPPVGSNSGTHCEVALRWMPQNLTKEKWNFLRLLSNWMRGKQFQSNLNSATARGPFRKQFFQQHSNAMEISFYSNRNSNKVITTKLCTWHNHCTVVGFWHVQKFVAIWWPTMELQQSEVSIEFELRAKIVIETGPRPRPCAMWSNVP